ncbi:MAG: Hsp20/alpha crystallin family protein [Desulfatibacillaceae bacterium]
MLTRPFFSRPFAVQRNPFEELDSFRRQMEAAARESSVRPYAHAGVFPLVNVTEDKDAFYVRAELPGVDPADVDVSVTGKALSLSGQRKIEAEEGVSYHRRERRSGSFSRTLTMPSEVDPKQVKARAQNGVLTIILPKSETAKPRQISVQS